MFNLILQKFHYDGREATIIQYVIERISDETDLYFSGTEFNRKRKDCLSIYVIVISYHRYRIYSSMPVHRSRFNWLKNWYLLKQLWKHMRNQRNNPLSIFATWTIVYETFPKNLTLVQAFLIDDRSHYVLFWYDILFWQYE